MIYGRAALVLFLSCAALSAPARAAGALSFGAGMSSCATWLENEDNYRVGTTWIDGFWTGMNQMNEANPAVGEATDPEGIYADIRGMCAAQPSMKLLQATWQAYRTMESSGPHRQN